MKNNLHLFGSALTMSLFWLAIYFFGKQMAAAYLAGVFGLISFAILSWLLFKFMIVVKVQSRKEIENIRKHEMAEKVMLKKS